MLQSRAMPLSYPDAAHWYFSFARFDARPPRESDHLKLARMNEILAHLDNPHQKFPSVLIAGTKGKGSTAALIENSLRAAGYRTGLFTSPHLHSFRERVRVNGAMISPQRVIEITTRLQEISTQFPISTFFEWITALAFENFAREKVDIAVVEVGLGGRLDCTNVLTPRVSVITPISYDHMEILGDTLEKIAFQKAGIIKETIPVVIAPQEPEAMQAIEKIARKKNAPRIDVAREWEWQLVETAPDAQRVKYRRAQQARWHQYKLPLLGPHQRVNLATALAALETLRAQNWKLPARAIQHGIENVAWHARFEILPPLPRLGEGLGVRVIADGAHNRASAHELVRTLDEVFPNTHVHFIFGASSDKDIAGMLQEFAPRAASFIFTQAHHARAASQEKLAQLAAPLHIPIHSAANVADALHLAQNIASNEDVICVTGSLFIAAEARAEMVKVPSDK